MTLSRKLQVGLTQPSKQHPPKDINNEQWVSYRHEEPHHNLNWFTVRRPPHKLYIHLNWSKKKGSFIHVKKEMCLLHCQISVVVNQFHFSVHTNRRYCVKCVSGYCTSLPWKPWTMCHIIEKDYIKKCVQEGTSPKSLKNKTNQELVNTVNNFKPCIIFLKYYYMEIYLAGYIKS